MKRKTLAVVGTMLAIASIMAVVVSAHGPAVPAASAKQITDAAFRDGRFQAKIDIRNGRGPHLASGRWSSFSDRALFIAGYQQEYREFYQTHAAQLIRPTSAQLVGYSDGVLDGSTARRASQPFHAEQTENYRRAGQAVAAVGGDFEHYKQIYRHAYSNGYQEGYYGQQDQQELKTVGQTAAPF
jgi:hypothetical protein